MRSWVVIPAMGAASGCAAVALGGSPTAALAGVAIAAVVRMLAGDSPAALAGAVLAPILAVASWADAGGGLVRSMIAVAAAGWTVTELARNPAGADAGAGTRSAAAEPDDADDDLADARPDDAEPGVAMPFSPLVAVLPATVAAILDPSFVALLAIAGARLITLSWRRPRWALAVPVAGALAIVLAVIAGTSWPALGARWFAAAAHPVGLAVLAARTGELLGPLTAVAALAGLAALTRMRYAELALAAALAGAVLVDVRAGAPGPALIGLAAVLAGLAIGRLAALIRIPSGQAITGATLGVLVILPPAWGAVAHRPPAAHIGQASR